MASPPFSERAWLPPAQAGTPRLLSIRIVPAGLAAVSRPGLAVKAEGWEPACLAWICSNALLLGSTKFEGGLCEEMDENKAHSSGETSLEGSHSAGPPHRQASPLRQCRWVSAEEPLLPLCPVPVGLCQDILSPGPNVLKHWPSRRRQIREGVHSLPLCPWPLRTLFTPFS